MLAKSRFLTYFPIPEYLLQPGVGLDISDQSIKFIEKKLGIPRSTLSGWFKNILLTEKQKIKLQNNWNWQQFVSGCGLN